MWNGTIIWNGTISKYVLIRMGDRGAHFLFSVYSYNPHDTDFDGSWMLWNTLFKIQRRYVRIVLWLRIQQCTRCCFAHLGRRRGRYFLSDWSLCPWQDIRLHCRGCYVLCCVLDSRISAKPSYARRNGSSGSVKPWKSSFSSDLSKLWR